MATTFDSRTRYGRSALVLGVDQVRGDAAAAALALETVALRDESLAAQQRDVGEEVPQSVHLEDLLETGRVRALREPDAARLDPQEAPCGTPSHRELRVDRRAIEQWEVAVRRGGGEYLDVT